MEETLDNVESAMFGRMLQNAATGFLKAAVLAGIIGAAIGAALFAVMPDLLPHAMLELAGNNAMLAGAMTGAVACIVPAGAIGATAGIQSTRDARRYFRANEAGRDDALLPVEQDEVAAAVAPVLKHNGPEAACSVSHAERLSRGESPALHQL